MSSFVAVKDKNGEYQHYKVPEEVAVYIKQLEMKIIQPNKSKLEKVYPNRFRSNNE